MASSPVLYIIYNADSTIRGKLQYAYRKISSSTPENPACAACDLTHGGLSLTETPAWRETQKKIEAKGCEVKLWHRDEVEGDAKDFLAQGEDDGGKVALPVVLSGKEGEGTKVVVSKQELASCAGDANEFLSMLEQKGIFAGAKVQAGHGEGKGAAL